MFAIPTFAASASASPAGFLSDPFTQQIALFVAIGAMFYLLILRPQQQRARDHRNAVGGVKRNDQVILSNGVIGKVVRVEETEVGVEVAQGVTVKVVKSMIAEVRSRGDPAPANDSRAKKS